MLAGFLLLLGLCGGVERAGAKPGCHTERCRDRVWNRAHPFRSALASWYDAVGLGGAVACGGRYPGGMIVAHKSLPCGTRLRVCYRGRCVNARVMDRGPYVGGREFDLDAPVRGAIGFDGVGVIRVRLLR